PVDMSGWQTNKDCRMNYLEQNARRPPGASRVPPLQKLTSSTRNPVSPRAKSGSQTSAPLVLPGLPPANHVPRPTSPHTPPRPCSKRLSRLGLSRVGLGRLCAPQATPRECAWRLGCRLYLGDL